MVWDLRCRTKPGHKNILVARRASVYLGPSLALDRRPRTSQFLPRCCGRGGCLLFQDLLRSAPGCPKRWLFCFELRSLCLGLVWFQVLLSCGQLCSSVPGATLGCLGWPGGLPRGARRFPRKNPRRPKPFPWSASGLLLGPGLEALSSFW